MVIHINQPSGPENYLFQKKFSFGHDSKCMEAPIKKQNSRWSVFWSPGRRHLRCFAVFEAVASSCSSSWSEKLNCKEFVGPKMQAQRNKGPSKKNKTWAFWKKHIGVRGRNSPTLNYKKKHGNTFNWRNRQAMTASFPSNIQITKDGINRCLIVKSDSWLEDFVLWTGDNFNRLQQPAWFRLWTYNNILMESFTFTPLLPVIKTIPFNTNQRHRKFLATTLGRKFIDSSVG